MTEDLIAFLNARLGEREQLALACLGEVGGLRAGEPYPDGSGIAERDDYPSYPWGSGEVELAYMASTHPCAILADIASKRQIVDMHTGPHDCQDIRTGVYPPDAHLMGETPGAPWMHYSGEHFEDEPCPTLLLLALPYAAHEDYKPHWGQPCST